MIFKYSNIKCGRNSVSVSVGTDLRESSTHVEAVQESFRSHLVQKMAKLITDLERIQQDCC